MPPSAEKRVPNLLSIAGSDPSGGAGIQADLKTFAALRGHGMSVITAVTAQNSRGVAAVHLVPADFVARQIDVIFADIDVAAVKIGMLACGEIVAAVATRLAVHRPPFIVLDPVLAATSGDPLATSDVAAAIVHHVFPIATLVTPNLPETSVLSGGTVARGLPGMRAAALRLHARGARAVLVKGGHAEGATSDDLFFDGVSTRVFSAPRIATRNTHGTGCTLSAAIAAYLAHGFDLAEAIAAAKTYLTAALDAADALEVGRGPGPLHHFHALWRSET